LFSGGDENSRNFQNLLIALGLAGLKNIIKLNTARIKDLKTYHYRTQDDNDTTCKFSCHHMNSLAQTYPSKLKGHLALFSDKKEITANLYLNMLVTFVV
jgi:hypothetical protein